MVPRDLFLELGGFDPDQMRPSIAMRTLHFESATPAIKVIYQPMTRVIQHARVLAREQPSAEFRNQEQAPAARSASAGESGSTLIPSLLEVWFDCSVPITPARPLWGKSW